MTRTNPWQLLIGFLALLALVSGVLLELDAEPRALAEPLLAAGLGLACVWLAVSAISWEIRRRSS